RRQSRPLRARSQMSPRSRGRVEWWCPLRHCGGNVRHAAHFAPSGDLVLRPPQFAAPALRRRYRKRRTSRRRSTPEIGSVPHHTLLPLSRDALWPWIRANRNSSLNRAFAIWSCQDWLATFRFPVPGRSKLLAVSYELWAMVLSLPQQTSLTSRCNITFT